VRNLAQPKHVEALGGATHADLRHGEPSSIGTSQTIRYRPRDGKELRAARIVRRENDEW
jgi:hypothetical protein